MKRLIFIFSSILLLVQLSEAGFMDSLNKAASSALNTLNDPNGDFARAEEERTKQEKEIAAREKVQMETLKAKKQAEIGAKEKQDARFKAFSEWDSAPAKAKADAQKGKTIVFKSLYLGMPIDDAHHLLFQAINSTGPSAGLIVFPELTEGNVVVLSLLTGAPTGIVVSDSNGNVEKIALKSPVTDLLFGVSGMEASAFAKQFMDAYNIPTMDVSDNLDSWIYTGTDGAKISINLQKSVLLEKIATKAEQKKTFD
jgi:hypothetical protein